MQNKICLIMLVKNEQNVIVRCLEALKPWIDCWVICDTGSEDDTKSIISKTMEGVSGQIFDRPWFGFAKNRSELIELAKEHFPNAEYLLMIDADDTWIVDDDFSWPHLHHDTYGVKHMLGTTSWIRPALFKASLPWRYEGVAHEYMTCGKRHTKAQISGCMIKCGNDGHRRTTEPVEKYKRVAKQLQDEYDKGNPTARTVFYLAQSYRDAGDSQKAIKYYKERFEMGGWIEEVYQAAFEIGRLHQKAHDAAEAQDWYIRAYETLPMRAEPLHAMAFLLRREQKYAMAYLYAQAAEATPYPKSSQLFVDESVYAYRSLDEYAVLSAKLGYHSRAALANIDLLIRGAPNKERIESNLRYSREHIRDKPFFDSAIEELCKTYPNDSQEIRAMAGISRFTIHSGKVTSSDKVCVVLATHQCKRPEYLCGAIESILNQVHENLELWVIFDGDEAPLLDEVKAFDDPRLRCYVSPENIGQFAIYQAALQVTDAPLFAVQDDDDFSHPDRLSSLLALMIRDNSDVVFSSLKEVFENGVERVMPTYPERLSQFPRHLVHCASHLGLWNTEALRKMGGYYPGFRIGADTMILGLMARLGTPSFYPQPTYTVRRRSGSMTTKAETGGGTVRSKAWKNIGDIWRKINGTNPMLRVAQAQKLLEANRKDDQPQIDALASALKELV